MKNTIKKITAFAMAFTLLGSGTAVTKTVSPSSFTTMTAEAATTEQNERTIYEFLTNDLKLNTAAACGVIVNIESESGLDPTKGEKGVSSGGGYGICQWTGSRKTNLINHCKSNGLDYTTLAGQLSFLKKELEANVRAGVYKKLQNASDNINGAYDASYNWCMYFESPYYRDKKRGQYDKNGNSKANGGYDYYPMYAQKYQIAKTPSAAIGLTESQYRGNLAKDRYQKYLVVTKKFTDVNAGSWYVNAIQFVFNQKYMAGKSASHFDPSGKLTRAEFATVLNNMAGKTTVSYSSNEKPSDVKDNQWYTQPVMWAYKKGITNGIGTISKSKFGVSVQITREEIVTMLYNYAKFRGKNVSNSSSALQNYSDKNQISTWAKPAMQWAVGKGVMSGKSSKILDPRGTATRAECAQFILNYANKIGL